MGEGFTQLVNSKDFKVYSVFYVRLNSFICGGQEQYDLLVSQFTCVPPDASIYNKDGYEYQEFISTKNQHAFKYINSISIGVGSGGPGGPWPPPILAISM